MPGEVGGHVSCRFARIDPGETPDLRVAIPVDVPEEPFDRTRHYFFVYVTRDVSTLEGKRPPFTGPVADPDETNNSYRGYLVLRGPPLRLEECQSFHPF